MMHSYYFQYHMKEGSILLMSGVREKNSVATPRKQNLDLHKQLPSKSQLSEYQVDDL